MKSFLVKGKKPIIKWGSLPDNTFFKGQLPKGYSLAVSPWGYEGYVVVDVDKHGDVDGFKSIPVNLLTELCDTFNYATKNNGRHYWLKYTGDTYLANKSSKVGIDLRTNKGYAVWYSDLDVQESIPLMKETSVQMNEWLELLFSFKGKSKNK